MARPTKYKDEFCERLIRHMAEGLSFKTFAYEIGVSEETIHDWCRTKPKFSESKRLGRAAQEAFYEKFGRSAMAGKVPGFNSTAFVWMTKNMLGWREKSDVQISGQDGGAIRMQHEFDQQSLNDLAAWSERMHATLQNTPKQILGDE